MKNTLYQYSTLEALLNGVYEGNITINDLLEKGNLGLGTLNGGDGELIIIGGAAYQACADNTINKLSGNELIPYGGIVKFEKNKEIKIVSTQNSLKLKEEIKRTLDSKNIFSAIKITGKFKKMHVRILPKQHKPYQKLVDAVENQPEYIENNLEGDIVGFYAPILFQGVAAGEFHLHFIDKDKKFGGHILDFEIDKGLVEIQSLDKLLQEFPTNKEFQSGDFYDENLLENLKKAEE